MGYMEEYKFWLENDYFDQKTKEELKGIEGNNAEIEDRFYKDLEFGTGGLRGVIGAGTNRMNIYTVRKATQGLANFIKKQGGEKKGVAIAYDSRFMSPEFADVAALCLAANGIKAYVFDELRPTPELSFALRTLGCISGIVVTASHNPPEYNGYKVYWEDGAQVTAPKDKEIINEVKAVTDYADVLTMDKETAVAAGLYQVIGSEIDDADMVELKKQIIHPEVIQEMADDIKIVYTPFHGTGNKPVRRVLSELGFKHVYVVPEQELPDPEFTTLDYPNPEDPKAFTLALKLAKEKHADIVMATDPDADRLGIYALDTKSGEYVPFTGNMSGMLIAEYILRERTATGTMPASPAMVKTIVTTNMADPIAADYHVKLIEVLTGFKYIGEQILGLERAGEADRFVFGFEESYGYLAGTYVRDKDAVVTSMLICEMAAYYRRQGKSLVQVINELYDRYGYYQNTTLSYSFEGAEGMEIMAGKMSFMREHPFREIAGMKVVKTADYQLSEAVDLATGQKTEIKLPKSNVLSYSLEGGAAVIVRPSGTEPKIKVYVTSVGKDLAHASQITKRLGDFMSGVINQ